MQGDSQAHPDGKHDLSTEAGRLAALADAISSARQVGVFATVTDRDNQAWPIRLILQQKFPGSYRHTEQWADLLGTLIDQLQEPGRTELSLYRTAVRRHYGVEDGKPPDERKHETRRDAAADYAGRPVSMWQKHDRPRTEAELAKLLLAYHDPWAGLPPDLSNPTMWIETAFRRSFRLGMRALMTRFAEPIRPVFIEAERADWIDVRLVDLILNEFVLWLQLVGTQPTWSDLRLAHTALPLDPVPSLIQDVMTASPLADLGVTIEIRPLDLKELRKRIPAAWFREPGVTDRITMFGVRAMFLHKGLAPYVAGDADVIIDQEEQQLLNLPNDVMDCFRHLGYLPTDIMDGVATILADGGAPKPSTRDQTIRSD